MIWFRILDSSNSLIYDSIPPSVADLVDYKKSNHKIPLPFNGVFKDFRVGTAQNSKGRIVILTDEKKFVNSKGVFGEFLSINLLVLEAFGSLKNEISEKYNKQTTALVHNLIKLNAQNIQSIFSLVPNHALTKDSREQLKIVSDKIQKEVDSSAKTFLRVAKNNISMKVEFSVFDKLMEKQPRLTIEKHDVRKVVLSVLQIFFQDFQEREIDLQLSACESEVEFDFETINVCLYYLIENALKYCKPKSTLKIILTEEDMFFKICFDMISLQVLPGEESQLFNDGFCGRNALTSGKSGFGIGMYRAYKTLALNKATIEFKPRITPKNDYFEKYIYEHNLIELKFPFQKSWFDK